MTEGGSRVDTGRLRNRSDLPKNSVIRHVHACDTVRLENAEPDLSARTSVVGRPVWRF
jgi:hypothetical protein